MSLLRPDGVTIIAEIGSNHNGELETAFKLIDIAAEAGADVCKFQSFLTDHLMGKESPFYAQMKKLELPKDWYPLLMEHCRRRNVRFLSTATNFITLEWLREFGVDGFKVASCNITHRPLLDRLIAIGKPVILSTGMATLDLVMETARHLKDSGLNEFAFLHCISKYPTQPEDMHLGNIGVLKSLLPCPVGLSDHSHTTYIPAAAVALGARIVEKHISLDRSGIGLDHEVAVLPDAFREMCSAIRAMERAMDVAFTPDAADCYAMRRSLHFARPLAAGAVVGEDDIKVVRPENGLMPMFLPQVIGRRLAGAVADGEPLAWAQFEGGQP